MRQTLTARLSRALFAPAVEAGPARRRAIAVAALLGLASVPLTLLRQSGSAVDNVWAEDGAKFLDGAYDQRLPGVLLVPYAGYASVYPRLVAEVAAHVRVVDAPAVLAVGGAAACAVAVFVTVLASEGHLRSLALRAVLGAAVALFPLAGVEIAGSACNAQWYLMAAALWAVLWHSRGVGGALLAGVLLALGASSDPLLGLFLPIAALRLVALPGWRNAIPGVGLVLGLLVQVPSLLHPSLNGSPAHPTPTPPAFGTLLASWLYRGPTEALLGPQLPVRLGGAAILVSCAVLLAAIVATGTARAGRGAWLAGAITLMSAGLFMIPARTRWTPFMEAGQPMLAASRYNLAPSVMCLTVVVLGVDAITERRPGIGGVLGGTLAVSAAVFAVAALPLGSDRLPSWSAQLPAARARCADLTGAGTATSAAAVADITEAPAPNWFTVVPCRVLVSSRAAAHTSPTSLVGPGSAKPGDCAPGRGRPQ